MKKPVAHVWQAIPDVSIVQVRQFVTELQSSIHATGVTEYQN